MSFVKDIRHMFIEKSVKIVIRVSVPAYRARLRVNGKIYEDEFNLAEPYDRKTHVFTVPVKETRRDTVLVFSARVFHSRGLKISRSFVYGMPVYAEKEDLLDEYDNRLKEKKREEETVCDGVIYRHILYENKKGAPVHVFVTEFDPEKAELYVGTPADGYKSRRVKATIPEMISAAEKNGADIVSAVNADFFDMFGDGHPSGLCVKNGRTIANEESDRPFIALKKDGSHVITSLKESPDILPELTHAAAGMQLVLKDGEIFDYAPLEPFSFTPHPRTCAGIKKDGTVILLVADGRIPDYSNGATLVDLARLMQSYGADRALNMDGGGSSAMYTKKDGAHVLHSRPADLVKPTANLIRKDYNSLLVRKK